MALATLIAITLGVSGGVCGSVASPGRLAGSSPPPSTSHCRVCCSADVPVGIGDARPLLHALTGKWNLEDYLGHDPYIVAASAVVYNALGRLQDDHAMQRTFKQYVECPATLCIPLLLVTFTLGNGATIYRADFFQVPTDFWLNSLLAAALRHADLPAGLRGPRPARAAQGSSFPPSRQHLPRRLGGGVAACLVRLATAFVPPLQTMRVARWCGSSHACAAPGSRSHQRNPGDQDQVVHAPPLTDAARRLRPAAARRTEHRTPGSSRNRACGPPRRRAG